MVALFGLCGFALILFPINPAWRVVLCFPLALYVAAGVKYVLEHTPPTTWAGVWGHCFVLLLIISQAFREARRIDE